MEVYRLPISRQRSVHTAEYVDSRNESYDPPDAYGRPARADCAQALRWMTPVVYGVMDERHVLVMLGHHVPPCGLSTTVYVFKYTWDKDGTRVYKLVYNDSLSSINTEAVCQGMNELVHMWLDVPWPEFVNAVTDAYRVMDVDACGP